jgi:hypothetical protein
MIGGLHDMNVNALSFDAPYDKYVNTETRFWNASGIDNHRGKKRNDPDDRKSESASCARPWPVADR